MMCDICKGLIVEPDKVYGYSGPICRCTRVARPFRPTLLTPEELNQLGRPRRDPAIPLGWQCPVCNAVHAPSVKSCPNQHV